MGPGKVQDYEQGRSPAPEVAVARSKLIDDAQPDFARLVKDCVSAERA